MTTPATAATTAANALNPPRMPNDSLFEAASLRQAVFVVSYQEGCANLTADRLHGFFDGWPNAPTDVALLRVLRNSTLVVVAWDRDDVVGFVNALSDGELAAYIPLLEVKRDFRGQGIGSELIRRVLEHFSGVYMIDAVCDDNVVPFYERFGLARINGMAHRNREAGVLRG